MATNSNEHSSLMDKKADAGWESDPQKWFESERLSGEGERIVVDPDTGGMKASKPCQLGYVDPLALEKLGDVAGYGAEKYDKWNYMKGFDWSLSFNAMMRHALAFWNGEDYDEENGAPHMASVMWHAAALISFAERGIGNDDRFKDG